MKEKTETIKNEKQPIFDILINTGARIEEALNIKPEDFDWERNNLTLRVTKIKARKGEMGPRQFKNLIRYRVLSVKKDDAEIPAMEEQIKQCILCGNCTQVCSTIVGAKLKEFNENWRAGKVG